MLLDSCFSFGFINWMLWSALASITSSLDIVYRNCLYCVMNWCFVIAEEEDIVDTSTIPIFESEVDCEIHGILKKESVNTTSLLEKLRFQPQRKSKITILLCMMVLLPIVRIFLKNNIMNLNAHFVACGYMEVNKVCYVAIKNNEGNYGCYP
jgi:hypothetical protein